MDDINMIHKLNQRVVLLLWILLIIDVLLNMVLRGFSTGNEIFLFSFLPLTLITIFVLRKTFIKITMYLISFLLMLVLIIINYQQIEYINLFFVILPIFLSISYREWKNVFFSTIGSSIIFISLLLVNGEEYFIEWTPTDSLYFLLFFLTFGSVLILEYRISENIRQKLLDSERRYRAMVKQSTEGIFAFHPDSKTIVETNEEFCKMIGYEENELINLCIEKIIVDNVKTVEDNIENVLKKNRYFLGERRYRCKNGDIIIVEVRATLISFDHDRLILANIRNITEDKKKERLIKKQEKLIHSVYEAMNKLLTDEDHVLAIQEALGMIGKAASVDHLYVFESKRNTETDKPSMRFCYEWINENAEPHLEVPIMRELPDNLFSETDWYSILSSGQSINGPLKQFSAKEQKLLKRLKMESVLIVPIFIQEEFWGFIGFSDAIQEKTWSREEEMTLMAAATNIGVAIKRNRDSIKLQESEMKYRLIADNMSDVVCLVNRDGKVLYVSPSYKSLMEELPDDSKEGYPIKYIHPDDWKMFRDAYLNMLKNKTNLQIEYRWRYKNRWINIELRAMPIIEKNGEIEKIVMISRNITERVRMEEKVRQTTSRLETLISHLPYGILAEDKDNKLILLNDQFTDMFGSPHLVNSDVTIREENKEPKMVFFEQELYDKRTREIIRNRKIVLDEEWALLDGRVISRDAIPIFTNHEFDGFLWQFKDITNQKKIEQELKEASLLDGLTKISNRRYFDEMIMKEWKRCSRSSKPLCLIMLDIDLFKKYNDTYGHQRGDECLIKVAQTIKQIVKRPSDVVCRYGGEEFVIILPETTEEGGEFVAEEIRMAIEKLEIPHVASDVSPFVTCSLGVATVIPGTLSTPEEIIRMADKALYDSKHHGRNRYCVYGNKTG